MNDFYLSKISDLEKTLYKNGFEISLIVGHEFIIRIRQGEQFPWIYVASSLTLVDAFLKLHTFLESKTPINPLYSDLIKFSSDS